MNADWVYADSGGFIALFLSCDQHHESAKSFQRQFTGLVYTTPLVVAETHDFLLYHGGSTPALDFYEAIQEEKQAGDLRLVSLTEELMASAHHLLKRYRDRTITLVDAVGMAFLQSRQKPRYVFGFDNDFRLIDECLLLPKQE